MAPFDPPETVVGCEPLVETANATEFFMRNKDKAQNFVWGELVNGGQLSFLIENLPRDGTGCPGWWMFEVMMRHFRSSVTAIQGNWTYGDNLATVNSLTAGGISLEDAARQGPTGKYAAAWGFVKIQVLPLTTGTAGNYLRVHVLFEK